MIIIYLVELTDFNKKTGTYQSLLNQLDTDKTDKGIIYDEILKEVDKNNDNIVSKDELLNFGFDSESSELVLNKIQKAINSNEKLVYELVELDEKVFPGGITKISISDIQQGKRNVCYFLASLAGLALNKREDDILKMIDKNRDNTFTITFPGIKGNNTFKVNYPSTNDLEKLIFPGKNGSIWVPLMVNAYTKYGESGGRPFKHIFAKDFVSDYGLTWEGIETQTGHRAESFLLDFYDEKKLLDNIEKYLNNKKVITICTFLKGNISTIFNPKKNEYKLSKAHIMTITGLDKEKGIVYIRDPYGKYEFYDENGKVKEVTNTDGLMAFNVKDLRKYFLDISFETEEEGKFTGIKNIFKRFF
ncbi:MAG: hypothetical protein KatS3mg068_0908 [Candidatus Sericytochromatia bacterium]|nr:MAG: hypothetical protein KatS3mg068_0908 [Candidatus Sericytochromatia bacterium]